LINENYERATAFLAKSSEKKMATLKACECFENAKQFATNNDDTLQANEMIKFTVLRPSL
jgi:hypothetical protein